MKTKQEIIDKINQLQQELNFYEGTDEPTYISLEMQIETLKMGCCW